MDSATVSTLFEKSSNALPIFVPAMPSLKVGLSVGVTIFIIGILTALIDRHRNKDSLDVIEQTRWLFIVAITTYVAGICTDFVRDKHYAFASVALNKQHYANTAWLREYVKALRG